MKTLIKLTATILFILFAFSSKATHVAGADITYRSLGKHVYEITIEVYRDCRGVPLPSIVNATRYENATRTQSIGSNLKLISIVNITPVCDTVKSNCNPQNTPGSTAGIEKHTYRDTINLNDSTHKFLLTGDKFYVYTAQCCRNSAITTGSNSSNFYTYAEIYTTGGISNNSPVFYEMPFTILTVNQPFKRNFGGYDLDGDSLVFETDDPLINATQKANYNTGFYKDQPFTVYYPTGTSYPYSNPNANPPIGFNVNSKTGYVTFTPVKNGEVSILVLKVKEYRNGKLISVTRREMQFWVTTGTGNVMHKVLAPDEICVVEGEKVDFKITTSDDADTAKSGGTDSVFLSIENSLPGAVFKSYDSIFNHGTFSWKTNVGDGKNTPYVVTFSARDNSCPINEIVQKTVIIRVVPKMVAPTVDFEMSVDSAVTHFINTSSEPKSILGSTWYLDGRLVSRFDNWDSTLKLDTSYNVKLIVMHSFSDKCGNNYYYTDSVVKNLTPKSCKAHYTIGLDTNQSKKFRIYLINTSTGDSSNAWYFSDGDSVKGTGFHKFTKFGKYEVCLKVSNKNCEDIYCDSIGMDSLGRLYKVEGFTIVMVNDFVSTNRSLSIDNMSVYPVPFTNKLTVVLPETAIRTVKLIDLSGRTVYVGNDISSSTAEINTSSFIPGLYFITIQTAEGEVINRKVIKRN